MAKRRSANSAWFINGAFERPSADASPRRRWRSTNHTTAASAATSSSATTGVSPPRNCTRPLSRHKVPKLASTRLGQSSPAPSRLAATPPGAEFGTKRADIHNDATQNGTTMKNSERQPNRSTSTPPRLGPSAGASTTPVPNTPIARPCSCGANARRMMMAGIGCTTPAARPSATRAASTSEKSFDRPPTTPPASSTHMVPP